MYYSANLNNEVQLDSSTLIVPSMYASQTSPTYSSWTQHNNRVFNYSTNIWTDYPSYRTYRFIFTLPDNVDPSFFRVALTCSDGMIVDQVTYPFAKHIGDGTLGYILFLQGVDYRIPPLTTNIIEFDVYTSVYSTPPVNGTVTAHLFNMNPSARVSSTGYGIKFNDSSGTEIFGSNYRPFKVAKVIEHNVYNYPLESLFDIGSYTAPTGLQPMVFSESLAYYGKQVRFGWVITESDYFSIGFRRSGNTITLGRRCIIVGNTARSTPMSGLNYYNDDYVDHYYVYYQSNSLYYYLGTSVT